MANTEISGVADAPKKGFLAKAFDRLDPLKSHLDRVARDLGDDIRRSGADHVAQGYVKDDARDDYHASQEQRLRYTDQQATLRRQENPDDVARLDAATAADRQRLDAEHKRHEATNDARNATLANKAACDAYAKLNMAVLKLAKPIDLRGDASSIALEAAAAEVTFLAEKKRIAALPDTFENMSAIAQRDLERLRGDGDLFTVNRKGRVTPRQQRLSDAVARGDTAVAVDDAVALHLSDPKNYQAALESIERQLRDRLRGTESMSDADKKAALADLDAKILAANRREATAVWAMKAAGQRVYHRAGLDPRALLSLDGPPPQRR